MDAVRLDWVTMGFAAVATGVSGVLSGVAPAFRSARADVLPALREGAGGSAGPRASGARQSLLITEAALAVMLLVAALLVGRSLGRLMDVDAGYDADNVLTARVYLPGATEGRAQTDAFVAQLLERLRAVPDVVAAGAGGMAPFGDSTMATALTIPVPGRESVVARSRVYVVTPGYAEALRLRLRAGRLLDEADFASSSQSPLVNEEFVRTFLQGGVRPLGFTIDSVLARGVRAEIVGVVGNVLKEGLRATVQPEVYVVPAHRYNIRSEIHVLVRTARDPSALAGTLRGLVRELRADAAIDRVTTLAAQVSESVGTEQSATTTLRGLALAAMLLAAVGLYGVLSHLVSTREREIGVRAALGATRRQIAWLVVGDGLGTTIVGLLIGLAAAAGVTRLMKALLFGIDPLDPVSFVLAAMGLSVVSLVSCALAARRATRVDPLVALRSE